MYFNTNIIYICYIHDNFVPLPPKQRHGTIDSIANYLYIS